MKKSFWLVFGLAALVLGGCDVSVNRSIHVSDGENGSAQTSVNGSIHIGARCRIEGDCRTVNGSIHVGDGSRVRDLDTVNGRIELTNCEVDEELSTVNGDIELLKKSLVHGDIVIKGRHGGLFDHAHLSIWIKEGSRVEGGIIVRDPDVDVTVYISKDSTVMGKIENAQAIGEY